MQVIRQTCEVDMVTDPVIRAFIVQRIAEMAPDWEPQTWEDYGQFLVLEAGDDPFLVEGARCMRLVSSPFESARLGDDDFVPIWDVVEDHGSFFAVGMVVADAGNFDMVLIPKATCTSPALLALCQQMAARHSLDASTAGPDSPQKF